MRASVSLGTLVIVMLMSSSAYALDRADRTLGAEMSRERAESRIERLKLDRADKERRERDKERTDHRKDRDKP